MLRISLVVLLLIKSIECEEDRNVSAIYKKLRKDTLKDYDRNARPVLYNSNVTKLIAEMHLVSTFEVDEQAQTIDIDSYMALHWHDYHLNWEPEKYEDIILLQMSTNEIWTPDLHELKRSGRESDIRQSDFSFIIVYHDGFVSWYFATVLPGTCKFDYHNYPSDVAVCTILLESWSHEKDTVDISEVHTYNGKDSHLLKPVNSQWELTSLIGERRVLEDFTSAKFTLTLTRKTPILQQQLLWISSVIVVILTLGMFWIPADIEQKITIGCAMMVIMTGVLVTVVSFVDVRQPVTLIAGIIDNLMHASTAAILLEIIAINLEHIQEWKPPEFLLNILSGTVGRILLISSAQQDKPSLDKMKLSEPESGDAVLEQLITTGNWKTISQALDRVAFLLYIVILSAMPKTP